MAGPARSIPGTNRGIVRPCRGPFQGYFHLVIYDATLDDLLQKVWDGGRIDAADAARLYHLPLEELGALADRRRQLARAGAYGGRGNQIVTYIIDRNVNYTNICNVYCKFCAFYRTEKDADAYVISWDEMDAKVAETVALGGTQILLQGGHHPKLSLQWYLDLLSHMKSRFPQVNIHGFSPSEFIHFREVFGQPLTGSKSWIPLIASVLTRPPP
jgi:cyclic dehypoxanthinyl futalosine synthase